MSPEQLKAAILEKYTSLHAFCKAFNGRICRSAVYQALNGSYPGNATRQLQKIKWLLNSSPQSDDFEKIHRAIKSVACARCRKKGRGACRRCRAIMREQAKQVEALFKGGNYVGD